MHFFGMLQPPQQQKQAVPVSEEKREQGEHVLEQKTTEPDERQKLTLALRDFERRLKSGGRSSRPSCRSSLTSCRSTRTSGKGSSSTSALKLECEGRPRERRDADVPLAVTVTRS